MAESKVKDMGLAEFGRKDLSKSLSRLMACSACTFLELLAQLVVL